MAHDNTEFVRRVLAAWNDRDLTTTRRLWHPAGEVDWSRSRGPMSGVYRGRAAIEAFQDEFWTTFEAGEIEAHDFIEVGADVVVPNTARMRAREGMEVIARSTFVFTVERGRVTRLRMFQERAEALEAVGLRGRGGTTASASDPS